jgi:apolipoprotein N-acyltransferase
MAGKRRDGDDTPAARKTPPPKAPSRGSGKKSGGIAPRTHLALGIPLAVVSGCLVFLSFPTFDLFPLQWFALVPLLVAVRGRTFRGGFGLGFVAGFVTNFGGFHWIADLLQNFGHMGPVPSWSISVLMGLYQGLAFALATGLAAVVTSQWRRLPWGLVLPVFITAVEHVAPFLFPWYFGNGQLHFPLVIQIVDITGVAGLTFLLVLFSGALGEVITARLDGRRFPWVTVALATLALAADVGYGVWRIRQVDEAVAAAPKFKVGVVESDVGIWEMEARTPEGAPLPVAQQVRMLYRNLLRHQIMSADLEAKEKPDLIVWPESSYMPLREVLWRRTDDVALATSADGRLWRVSASGVKKIEDPGVGESKASGLRGVAAASESQFLAVGPRGAAYSYDGAGWKREPTGTDRDLLAVASRPDGTASLAVGAQGTATWRAGGAWKPVDLGTTATLRGVAYDEARGFVVCGDGGFLAAFDKRTIKALADPGGPDLLACSWSPKGGLVAVGQDGSVVRVARNGTVTREQPVTTPLRGVASGATTWAVGDDGILVSCRDTCRKVPNPIRKDFQGVAGDGSGRAWATGKGGTVVALGDDHVRTLPGGEGDLAAVAPLPFDESYPLPRDVRHLYVSDVPLPTKSWEGDLYKATDADEKTPDADRNAALRGFRTPLLFGVMASGPEEGDPENIRDFNSSLLVDGDGAVLGKYDKNFLLLFGEYLPFGDTFPFLRKWLPEAGSFTPGKTVSVLPIGPARLGVLICYEGIIPSFTRKVALLEPNLLINLTNDAWFGKTEEPYLHMQLAAFRAVEHRRFFIRSTNTGVSVVVDPVGRILNQTSMEGAESFVTNTALLTETTIYTRHGDLFAWGCCVLGGLLAGFAMILRRKA